MLIYGIGRALVDYYIETSAADIIKTYLSSGGQIPVHIDGAAFNRLLSFVCKNAGTNGLPSSAGTGTIFIREPGGTCVNILKTMAILNRHIHATLSGTIGSGSSTGKQPDPDGFFFIESLQNYGVIPHLEIIQKNTGRCMVIKNSGSHSAEFAAASPEAASDIRPATILPDKLNEADWCIIEGMQLGNLCIDTMLMQAYRKHGTPLAIACGTPAGAASTAKFLHQYIFTRQENMSPAEPDVARYNFTRSAKNNYPGKNTLPESKTNLRGSIFCNTAEEISENTGDNTGTIAVKTTPQTSHAEAFPPIFTESPVIVFANDAEARILEQKGISFTEYSAAQYVLFVITHGCGGSTVYCQGNRFTAPAASPEHPVIDTTGAGDVFAAAFLTASGDRKQQAGTLTVPEHLHRCLAAGATAAAQIITVPLCSPGILVS